MSEDKILKWNQVNTYISIIVAVIMIISTLLIVPVRSEIKEVSTDFKEFKIENTNEHKDIKRQMGEMETNEARIDERLKHLETEKH